MKSRFLQIWMLVLLSILLNHSTFVFAQAQEEDEKVTLERAEYLDKDPKNPNVRKLVKQVIVKHKGTIFYCDSAYLHEEKNAVDAFGNTRMVGDDGTVLTADSMYYDGNIQTARAIGKVFLNDGKMRLQTKQLDYDIANGLAHYYSGGKLEDSEKTLTSETGTYDTNAKIFYFKNKVVLISKENQQKINTDNLTYNSISKIVYFKGKTKIESKDGIVYTNEGDFNTQTQVSNFRGRTKLEDEDYYLEGDSLYFDNTLKIGYALGNVFMQSKKDSLIAESDFAWYRGKEGESKLYGNVIARSFSEKDTLYLKADTLYSINEKEGLQRKYFTAYPKAKFLRTELQGIADSLVYNRSDSTISFFTDPVLWNKDSQMSADSIKIQLANNRPKNLVLRRNAFLISEDTLKNYNQLKGKFITAFFQENDIKYMQVRGNAENIYFALDEKSNQLIGMNRIECSDMNIVFKPDNKIHRISYINKADAQFIPPHEIQEPQTKFKNFRWRIAEKPQRSEMRRVVVQ